MAVILVMPFSPAEEDPEVQFMRSRICSRLEARELLLKFCLFLLQRTEYWGS